MRAVIQRVRHAEVAVDGVFRGSIASGLLVFLGVEQDDTDEDLSWLVHKVPHIRCFEDEDGRMNRSLIDVGAQAMVISQFTLFGSLKKGSRPSFNRAADPARAEALYAAFVRQLSELIGRSVETGGFGRHMEVIASNDGPVTLIVDSRRRDI